jgi:hypothetical protein
MTAILGAHVTRQEGTTMVDPARLRKMTLIAAVIVLGGTACSSSSGDASAGAGKPEVATLQSAAPSTAASSAAPTAPRERLDGTAEDFEILLKPYENCMKKHGLTQKGLLIGSDTKLPAKAVTEAATKECQPLYPLPPWERDPANPEAKDFARDVVKCLKAKGVKYVEVSEDGFNWSLGGPQNDSQSISKGMELSPECEREVAAKKK